MPSPRILFALLALLPSCLLQAQNLERGKQQFQQCAACHNLQAGIHGLGPSLNGILGQRAGSTSGFRFSGALKKSGIVWNGTTLDAFLANPQTAVPGNRMPFSGIENAQARKDLLLYLQTVISSSANR